MANTDSDNNTQPSCCPCDCGIPTKPQKSHSLFRILLSFISATAILTLATLWYKSPGFRHDLKTKFTNTFLLVKSADSFSYNLWSQPPNNIDIHFSVHLYNVTNADLVISKGEKPNLEQVGPIIYSIKTTKTNVSFYSNNTASYFNYVEMHLNLDATIQEQRKLDPNGTKPLLFPNSTLTIPNVPLLVIDNILRDYKLIPNMVVRPILKKYKEDKIFMKKTVNETLWGYEDPALKALSETSIVNKYVKIDPTFGLLQGQNNSYAPGQILVDLGTDDYTLANEILKINGQNYLTYWESSYANDIKGTDGQQMHPFVDRSENVTTFCSDIFRSIWMYYLKDEYIHGVRTYRYELPPEVFALPDTFPPNKGFCTKGKCPPGGGVLGVGTAEPMNAPVYVSQPHFLHADQLYKDAITGVSEANKTLHGTYVYLEPITGFIFGAAKRVQFNFLMRKSNLVAQMNNLPKQTFLPMFWYEIVVEVPTASALQWQFSMGLIRFFYLYGYIGWLIAGSFILLTMVIRGINRFALIRTTSRQAHQDSQDEERLLIESSHVDLDGNRLRRGSEINGFLAVGDGNVTVGQEISRGVEGGPELEESSQNSNDEGPLL